MLKKVLLIGCVLLVVGAISFPAWSANWIMNTGDVLMLAEGNGNGGTGDNGGNGPGDGTGTGDCDGSNGPGDCA
jgi:hypothetical protein